MPKYNLRNPLQILSHQGDALLKLIHEKITETRLTDTYLVLTLSGGTTVFISDEGQSCCESRYITTDDDVNSLIGAHLMCIEYKAGPGISDPESYDVHETGFVDVATTNGTVTLTTHNEHNGYYGGFSLQVRINGAGFEEENDNE